MSKISIGFSTAKSETTAVAEAVETALERLEGKPNLAILFSTVGYDSQKIVSIVSEKLGNVPIWGGTSSQGVIGSEGFVSSDGLAIGIMLLSGVQAGVGGAEFGDDAQAAGLNAAKVACEQIDGTPDVFLMLGAPGCEETVMDGIKQAARGAPIFGGSAADNSLEGNWRQFANDEVLQNGVAVAAVAGGTFGYDFSGGYRPTGKKTTLTKVDGRTLIELDGKPALSVYAELMGKSETTIAGSNILTESILTPLARKIGDFYQVCHPANATDAKEIEIFVNFPEGTELELMESNVDELIAKVKDVVGKAAEPITQPAGVLLVNCAGRQIAIGERMDEISAQVKAASGDVPLLGILNFGEQGTIATGESYHGNLMVSALVIG